MKYALIELSMQHFTKKPKESRPKNSVTFLKVTDDKIKEHMRNAYGVINVSVLYLDKIRPFKGYCLVRAYMWDKAYCNSGIRVSLLSQFAVRMCSYCLPW